MRMIRAVLAFALVLVGLLAFAPAANAATVNVGAGMRYGNAPSASAAITDFCTIGAVGYDTSGNKVAITAGHCAPVGAAAKLPNGTLIGTVATAKVEWQVGIFETNKFDYGFILLGPNVVLADDPSNAVNPKSVAAPTNGEQVCKFGHAPLRPGERCGWNQGTWPKEFHSTAASLFGDSGGPVYRQGNKTVLLGITSRPANFGTTAIQRVDAAVADATLNGSVGAGFMPIA